MIFLSHYKCTVFYIALNIARPFFNAFFIAKRVQSLFAPNEIKKNALNYGYKNINTVP
jgi:hypothetical protein